LIGSDMDARQALVPLVTCAALLAFGGVAPAQASTGSERTGPITTVRPQIRLDQLGYLPAESKHARLMTARRVGNERFVIVDSTGQVVLRGRPSVTPVGTWNTHYRDVYDLTFSRLTKPGRYRLFVRGDVTAASPFFRVAGADAIYGTLLHDGVRFDQVQRDGAQVIRGVLDRRPAHLHDRHARISAWPNFVPGSDTVTDADLRRLRGSVDVSGGWFDAGDYLKFTHSTAYNDVLLFLSRRMLGRAAPKSVEAEARHGLQWLGKMWDAKHQTLYIQVGIGSSNRAGTFRGDHDGWRLPQADDRIKGYLNRHIAHRPVFRAAAPGARISPNLVGRVSAAFALAAQVDAGGHPARARRELRQAKLLYARADTVSPPRSLVTALPHAFYPEDTWRDDMELGATEIVLASRRLGIGARAYLRDATRWARAYIVTETGDTLNLYDTSALAHADLARVLRHTRRVVGLQTTRSALVADIRRQLRGALEKSRHDPFSAGATYDNFDANSHTFALVATAGLYHQLAGRSRYDRFATRQRDWLLGGNPWGVSAMVGVGTTFPLCMQHQVANLSGTIDGSPPIDVGAVVNGPNAASNFSDGLGGFQDGMVHCPLPGSTGYQVFDGRHSRYVDDIRSWQTDEPALDMTGAAIIAGAVQLAAHRPH
jgi:endoglucanase